MNLKKYSKETIQFTFSFPKEKNMIDILEKNLNFTHFQLTLKHGLFLYNFDTSSIFSELLKAI